MPGVGWLTRRVPAPVKRRLPVVRERDALRARVGELEAELDRRGELPPAVGLHGTYAGGGRMLIQTVWGGLLIPANDLILMPELVVAGTYDVPFTAFVREHIQPGDMAIDVGAHVGLFTLLLAYEVWERGHVIAYEANPNTLPVLRDNIAMNYLDDRVEIVGRAAGARAGHAQLVAPERFRAMSSIQPLDEDTLLSGSKVDRVERFDVEVEPLDTHVGRFERIDLVKIDVEGAEEQVFAGMANLLESRVVRRVCFEVSREHMGEEWEPFTERMRRLEGGGWTFSTISEAGEAALTPLTVAFERGRFSQVLMQRGG